MEATGLLEKWGFRWAGGRRRSPRGRAARTLRRGSAREAAQAPQFFHWRKSKLAWPWAGSNRTRRVCRRLHASPREPSRATRKTRHGAPKPGAGLACKFSCRRHGFRGAHGCKVLRLHRTSRCGREFAPPPLVEQVSRSADISDSNCCRYTKTSRPR